MIDRGDMTLARATWRARRDNCSVLSGRYVYLLLCVMVSLLAGYDTDASAAGAVSFSRSVTSLTFPVITAPNSVSSYYAGTIGVLNGRVMVGDDTNEFMAASNGKASTNRNVCRLAVVQPEPLRLVSNRSTSCDDPSLAGQTAVPIESVERGGNTGVVRISVCTNSGGFRVGPIVMRYGNYSDTRPEWTYGGGSLWIFDAETPSGTEVLRISESTGAVLSRAHLPWSARVLLAADSDGLWIGQSPEGGWKKGEQLPLLEFVGNHASTPVVALQSPTPLNGGRVNWLVASRHTAIASIAQPNDNAVSAIDIFRSPSKPPQTVKTGSAWEPSSIGEGPADAPPVIEAGSALFSSKPGWDGQFSETPTSESIVRIDSQTGRDSQITSIDGLQAADFVAYVFDEGALYLLSHANGAETATLYRVPV
jgi:hypothetical protein